MSGPLSNPLSQGKLVNTIDEGIHILLIYDLHKQIMGIQMLGKLNMCNKIIFQIYHSYTNAKYIFTIIENDQLGKI
mgnify:CR=1 FL=1